MTITISERLRRIAQHVPQGARLVDVGTDHALLPIYLMQTGRIGRAIATDIAEGPVSAARRNVSVYGLNQHISVRLGPGLETVTAAEVDAIVIAGMGGGTAVNILQDSIAVVQAARRVIVQPMNASHAVRRYFKTIELGLSTECVLAEDGRFYEILVADADKPADFGYEAYVDSPEWMELAYELGPHNLRHPAPVFISFLQEKYRQWQHVLTQLQRSQSEDTLARQQTFRRRIALLQDWASRHGVVLEREVGCE